MSSPFRSIFNSLLSELIINVKPEIMKKFIILSFVSAAVIFFTINLSFSAHNTNRPDDIHRSYIHYQVVIHPDGAIRNNTCPLLVTLTNGSSMLIGQPQLYIKGINTYHFYEKGPVSGIRIATLSNTGKSQTDDVCFAITLSDSESGTFNNGVTYVFNLYGSGVITPDPTNHPISE
jgi:hypothetical protein